MYSLMLLTILFMPTQVYAGGSWQEQFPDREFVAWQKDSRWSSLNQQQSPPADVSMLETVTLEMGLGEYESTAFVLTNVSEKTQRFTLSTHQDGLDIELRKGIWVTTFLGDRVNDALSLIDENMVRIDSGDSLEIWVTLHSDGLKAGIYHPTVTIEGDDLTPHTVSLEVSVHDASLPTPIPLNTFVWDYVVPEWTSASLVEEHLAQFESHYINTATIHPWCAPDFAVVDGAMILDFSELDDCLAIYAPLEGKQFTFEWLATYYLEPASEGVPPFLSEEWKALFADWLGGWVAHLKELGLDYEDYAMHPYDERLDEDVVALLALAKEVDPNLRLIANDTGQTVTNVNAAAPNIDVWMPFLYDYLDYGYWVPNEAKTLAKELLGPGSEPTELLANGDMTWVQGGNLVSNGDMEMGDPPMNWSDEGNGPVTISAETVNVYRGTQSMKIVNNGRAITGAAGQAVSLTSKMAYTYTFAYYGEETTLYYDILVDGSAIDAGFAGEELKDYWSTFELQFSMPAGAKTALLRLFPATAGGSILIDEVVLSEKGMMTDATPTHWDTGQGVVLVDAETPDGSPWSLSINSTYKNMATAEQRQVAVDPSVETTLGFWYRGAVGWALVSDNSGSVIDSGEYASDVWAPAIAFVTTPADTSSVTLQLTDLDETDTPLLVDNISLLVGAGGDGGGENLFWTYANPYDGPWVDSTPYQNYRISVWRAWDIGATGWGYWIYDYNGLWNSIGVDHNWSVVYRSNAEDAPPEVSKQALVVPSKRWEATREGIEDYAWLSLLEETIAASELAADSDVRLDAQAVLALWPDLVLRGADADPTLADQAHIAVLRAIVSLHPEEDDETGPHGDTGVDDSDDPRDTGSNESTKGLNTGAEGRCGCQVSTSGTYGWFIILMFLVRLSARRGIEKDC